MAQLGSARARFRIDSIGSTRAESFVARLGSSWKNPDNVTIKTNMTVCFERSLILLESVHYNLIRKMKWYIGVHNLHPEKSIEVRAEF